MKEAQVPFEHPIHSSKQLYKTIFSLNLRLYDQILIFAMRPKFFLDTLNESGGSKCSLNRAVQ